jgi:hypothetical protein
MEMEADKKPHTPTNFYGIIRLKTISRILEPLPEGIKSKLFLMSLSQRSFVRLAFSS